MKPRYTSWIAAGIASCLLLSPLARSAEPKAVSPQQMIAAIQAAAATFPGMIEDVEVDREQGRLVVEVKIVDANGAKKEIHVDPATNQIVRK